jgi:hypothetical protein
VLSRLVEEALVKAYFLSPDFGVTAAFSRTGAAGRLHRSLIVMQLGCAPSIGVLVEHREPAGQSRINFLVRLRSRLGEPGSF